MAEGTLMQPQPAPEEDWQARYDQALEQLPYRSPIYLPTDKLSLKDRALGLERVVRVSTDDVPTLYASRLRALRGAYAGRRRAFIIGNGPSLNETDLSQLKDEVTFCVNGFFLKMPELDWVPSFYVVEDHLVAEDRADAINALKGPTKLFPSYLAYCLDDGDDTLFFNHVARKSFPDGYDFSTDASTITYTGCTVTFTCMQLAHYLGFQELYLIGVDASYDIPKDVVVDTGASSTAVLDMDSEDPNHFHPDYFGKGMRWHDPQVENMIEAYGEARRVSEQLGRPIFNATVGGKLEVFERRAYNRIFPSAKSPAATSAHPRLLILDPVPMGQMTATGELKSTLFGDWPLDQLMQVSAINGGLSISGGGLTPGAAASVAEQSDRMGDLIEAFDPELILFRPVPDQAKWSRFAFDLLEESETPIALWIVDDWPSHLERKDPKQHASLHSAFETVLQRAALRIAISDAMAAAFEARYGCPFISVSNAVDPADWLPAAQRALPSASELLIRYSGGLSAKMTLQSLLDLAEAVEGLPDDVAVTFEINTRPHWLKKYGHQFASYARTQLTCAEMAPDAYRRWLQAADMTAIVYNFDAESLDYVRYSMANKTVECLASGAPPIVYGPTEVHTVDYLQQNGLGLQIKERSVETLRDALTSVIGETRRLHEMGATSQAFAFAHSDRATVRQTLTTALSEVAVQRPQRTAGRRSAIQEANSAYRKSVQLALALEEGRRMIRPAGLGGRMSRIGWFYKSWRGVLAALACGLPCLAAAMSLFVFGTPAGPTLVMGAAMTGAMAIIIFFVGYVFTLIEDYASPTTRPRYSKD